MNCTLFSLFAAAYYPEQPGLLVQPAHLFRLGDMCVTYQMRRSVKEGEKVTTPLGSLVSLLGNLHPPFLYVMPSSLLSPLFLTLSQDL